MTTIKLLDNRDRELEWEVQTDGSLSAISRIVPGWSMHIHKPMPRAQGRVWGAHEGDNTSSNYATLDELVKAVEEKHRVVVEAINADNAEIMEVLGEIESES